MGNYNPHSAAILGQEWAPLRDPGYRPDDVTEVGETIRLEHGATIVSGYYYIKDNVPNTFNSAVELLAVYPAGAEDDTGPIQQVVIPASAISITGAGISGTVADIQNPADNGNVVFTIGQPDSQNVGVQFDVPAYQLALQGKRILKVEFIYTAAGSPENLDQTFMYVQHAATTAFGNLSYASTFFGPTLLPYATQLQSINMGDVNLFWNANAVSSVDTRSYPWRWEELNNFSTAANLGSRLQTVISVYNPTGSGLLYIGYVALRITYCEERRVLYGGDSIHGGANYYVPGPRPVQFLTPAFATPTALDPGLYTVTHSHRVYNDPSTAPNVRTAPNMYGIQEQYQVEPQVGKLVKQSTKVGDTFDVEETDFLPQLTLHTTAAIVTGSHPYGDLIGAPVYGSITAAQIISNKGNTAPLYPQVRFYARRFGDTSRPLQLTNGTNTVSITVSDFDALDEIADGWKEVTLRFTTIPTGTNVGSTWTFSASGEVAGNRWEVLGANGISPSAPQAIGVATYLAPTGSTQTLTWKSPSVTGATADTTADVTLLFSQDPPTVTGVGVEVLTADLVTATDPCDMPNECVPTGLYYNQITWDALGACDDFERTTSNDWNTAPTGQTWTKEGASAADYSVSNGTGRHSVATIGVTTRTLMSGPADVAFRYRVSVPAISTGVAAQSGFIVREDGTNNNFYIFRTLFLETGRVELRISVRVAGVETTIANPSGDQGDYSAGSWTWVEGAIIGSTLYMKTWADGDEPPENWQVTVIDTTFSAAGRIGFRSDIPSGWTGAVPTVFQYDDFSAFSPSLTGSTLQLQRMDTVDTDWQTIMEADDLCLLGFNDYEARVGVLSSYRIRLLNVYDFAGSWSATVSATVTAPGVVIPGDGNSVLIFTSNENRDASLAYTMIWDGQPIESFAFPEVETQLFQRFYGRDFQVAFRPLERGGEQFDRVILVNAAAISPQSLADFTGLRDLAWDDLPYVCVRDELGNRWFANVLVPSGTVKSNRRLYMAQIRVTEVTDTPSPASS